MEFENLHEHAAWLTKEVAAVKARLETPAAAPVSPELEALESRVAALEALEPVTLKARLEKLETLFHAGVERAKAKVPTEQQAAETDDGKTHDEGAQQAVTQDVRGA